MNILFYFLPAIIFLGILTSYEDLKIGKIKNKYIIIALLYAFTVYFLVFTYFYFTKGLNINYLSQLLTNFLFAILLGFGFWHLGIWTAGDGKLFIAFSALLPLPVYKIGYQKYIPSVTLLINIFIPALLIMLFFMLFKIKKKNLKNTFKSLLKELFQPKQLLNLVIYLFAIYWIIQLLLSLIGLSNNFILIIALTILVFSALQKKLKNKAVYLMLAISLLRLIIDKSVYSFSFLTDFLILVFVWIFLIGFLRGVISKLGQEIFSKEIRVNKLKQGMILSDVIQKKEKITKQELTTLKKQQDTKIIKYKDNYFIKKPKNSLELDNFIGEEAEGLTKQQIDNIKKLGIKKIKVSQTIPFAPFIFLGVVLTIIANGNILIVINYLI